MARWTGTGYLNVPGRRFGRTRWNRRALVVEVHDHVLTMGVNWPGFRSTLRRIVPVDDLWYVQDADFSTTGTFIPGVRFVGNDQSVAFLWFAHAHKVRSALAALGVEVREPMEDASPGRLGARQYET